MVDRGAVAHDLSAQTGLAASFAFQIQTPAGVALFNLHYSELTYELQAALLIHP